MTTSIFDAGAVLVPDFVTEREEARILERIYDADWLCDLSRRVQHYGYRYDYRHRGTDAHTPAAPFPRWAAVMAERMQSSFAPRIPEQCIVNEYRPGQGIGMHADHRSFGPVVASLSLADTWTMRFRPRRPGEPYVPGACRHDEAIALPRRSLLVLRGPARTAWMHGIAATDTGRYRRVRVSATFRTLART